MIIFYAIAFLAGAALGWMGHVWYKHNPKHIEKAETTVTTVAADEFAQAKETIAKAKDLVDSISGNQTPPAAK